jgi:hypothetical protein
MRKHLVWVLALAVALGGASFAWAANTQTVNGQVTPKKLFKKVKKPITLRLTVSTRDAADPTARPTPSSQVNVDIDKDIGFFNKGLKTCNPSSISTASTATAKSTCGNARVSTNNQVPYGGSGTPQNAAVVRPQAGSDIAAVVTVFNGPPQGKKPVVVLHTVNATTGTTVLTGVVGPPTAAGYGHTLAVPTPALAGGLASIIDFTAQIKKTYKFKGKKRSFVSSSCRDKKLKFQARATFQDGSSASGTSLQKCKIKPGP